jgi:hypothetical protein
MQKLLQKDIVLPGTLTVHADFDADLEKNIREDCPGELATLAYLARVPYRAFSRAWAFCPF